MMMLSKAILNRNSLGIDISADRINLVLLERTRDGIQLVKAAGGETPPNAVTDDNIKDPVALAKAIQKLASDNKISARRVTLSLLAKPFLLQIMNIPKQAPANLRQFIQSEVKHCAVLPGKNISFDYCGMAASGQDGNARVFVAAVENEKVAEIARAMSQTGLDLDCVEPAVLAYIRALYAKKVAGKFESNVLLAFVQQTSATICVFRKQVFDFIRQKDLGDAILCSDTGMNQFAAEIDAIIQYYDLDVPDSAGKWEIVVAADEPAQAAEKLLELLKNRFRNAAVHFSGPETLSDDTIISRNADGQKASLAAVGLAMGFLNAQSDVPKINLLSQELAEVKSVKKLLLVTANLLAAVFIIMILTVGALSSRLNKANQIIENLQQQSSEGIQQLLKEQNAVSRQIASLSDKLKEINEIQQTNSDIKWDKILVDVGRRTPRTVCLDKFFTKDDLTIVLEGRALSYEAVNTFINMLGKSDFIRSAALVETGKEGAPGGFVTYSINCSLNRGEGT